MVRQNLSRGADTISSAAIQLLDRLVARYSTDLVVSVSEDLRRKLIRHIPFAKVVTVYNGIDERQVFSALTVAEAKRRLGIPPEYGVVGTVGRLDPVKRLDIFLAAAREIVNSEAEHQVCYCRRRWRGANTASARS